MVPRVSAEGKEQYEMKIDNSKSDEQLHFVMNKIELTIFIESTINALLPDQETRERNGCELELATIETIKRHLKEREDLIKKEIHN